MRSFPNSQNMYSPSRKLRRWSRVSVPALPLKSHTPRSTGSAAHHAGSVNEESSWTSDLIAATRAGSLSIFSSHPLSWASHSYVSSGIDFSAASVAFLQISGFDRCPEARPDADKKTPSVNRRIRGKRMKAILFSVGPPGKSNHNNSSTY